MKNEILQKLPGVRENVLLADYTTYKIGGHAKYFFVAKKKEDLMAALKIAKDFKMPVFILGGGSNLLISDDGFAGLVIKIDIFGVDFQGEKVIVGAGSNLTKLAYLSAEKGFSGLEWSAGVPGTVGGAIYGNAQAFGVKISDILETVEAINCKTLKMKNFAKEQCQFSLKNSIFKKNKSLVIVSAVLKFEKLGEEQVKSKIKEFLEYRKTRHPVEFPSAGSVFVNPVRNGLPKTIADALAVRISNGVNPEKIEVIPAGYLIQQCGLAGKRIGNAQVSEKHANFIINLGGAKAKDVLSLIKLAKKEVEKKFNIKLEPEVQFVGFK
ncbi:MAG: UDP-N-acetylmuramate dehydrogenase [Candidatus Staskawiczbacteria bacterium]|nr:UDP-N-acetylmuramate dehydrogenase [Candidatus Staskawiczbacteria bacterium]